MSGSDVRTSGHHSISITRSGLKIKSGAPGAAALVVANFRPDVGFAWWLMENFWVQISHLAHAGGMRTKICYPEPGKIPASISDAGIRPFIQRFPGRSWSELWAAIRLVRERKIRIVYFTDRPFTDFRYFILRCAGVRTIVTHDHTPGDRPPVGGMKGLLKAIWRRIPGLSADLHLCVSPLIRERAIRNARIPASRAKVVQNGIPAVTSDSGEHYAHRKFGIPETSRICITVGRAHPYKRIDFVIEVARRCQDVPGLDDIRFIHCGDGPDMERLRSLVDAYDLADRFILAGRRDDVHQLLCSSTFALHAAEGEAFSLAILEYMSAGLCVFVPNTPSVSQAVTDAETGFTFPSGEVDAVIDLFKEIGSDSERLSAVSRAAQKAVRRHYSIEAMNSAFGRRLAGFF